MTSTSLHGGMQLLIYRKRTVGGTFLSRQESVFFPVLALLSVSAGEEGVGAVT